MLIKPDANPNRQKNSFATGNYKKRDGTEAVPPCAPHKIELSQNPAPRQITMKCYWLKPLIIPRGAISSSFPLN
jgi:hypothetical protein